MRVTLSVRVSVCVCECARVCVRGVRVCGGAGHAASPPTIRQASLISCIHATHSTARTSSYEHDRFLQPDHEPLLLNHRAAFVSYSHNRRALLRVVAALLHRCLNVHPCFNVVFAIRARNVIVKLLLYCLSDAFIRRRVCYATLRQWPARHGPGSPFDARDIQIHRYIRGYANAKRV